MLIIFIVMSRLHHDKKTIMHCDSIQSVWTSVTKRCFDVGKHFSNNIWNIYADSPQISGLIIFRFTVEIVFLTNHDTFNFIFIIMILFRCTFHHYWTELTNWLTWQACWYLNANYLRFFYLIFKLLLFIMYA